MRSFYCYVRTIHNDFFSCSVNDAHDGNGNLAQLAYRRFQELGNPLPPANQIYSMRFLCDPRNLTDMAGYEESRPHGEPEGYVAYSEYTSGVTPTN